MENPRIRDFMKITSFETVIKAIEESDERLNYAEELLETILDKKKEDESIRIDIMDLLYTISLAYYAKGIKVGLDLRNALE